MDIPIGSASAVGEEIESRERDGIDERMRSRLGKEMASGGRSASVRDERVRESGARVRSTRV